MAARRILYIGGWGRSGSSFLANVLGAHPRIASLGEVRYVWDRGVIEDKRCGCGRAFSTCPFWQAVFARAGLATSRDFAAEQAHRVGSGAVKAQMRAMLTGRVGHYAARNADALAALDRLYSSAADEAGEDVLIDASKVPAYAINLHGSRAFDRCFIHLVRDPRAVAYSWSRTIESLDANDELLPRYTALKSAVYWDVLNSLSAWFRDRRGWSYRLVRYEDFCRSPRATVDGILEHCELSPDGITWHGDHEVEVVAQHSISGNPSRFSVGRVAVALDDEWRTRLPATQRRLVSLVTGPFAAAFGYPDRPKEPPASR